MTEAQLNKIKERIAKATKGPWFIGHWTGQCHMEHEHGKGNCVYKYELSGGDFFGKYVSSGTADERNEIVGAGEDEPMLSYGDADFIAHARKDVPTLVEENERLRYVLSLATQVVRYRFGDHKNLSWVDYLSYGERAMKAIDDIMGEQPCQPKN